MNHLSTNLFILRKQKKLRQDEMQTALGISGGTWSNYENGKTEPQVQTLIAIAAYFEVSLDDLLTKDMSNPQSFVSQSPASYQSTISGLAMGIDAGKFGVPGEADQILKEMLDEIKGMRTDLQIFLNTKL